MTDRHPSTQQPENNLMQQDWLFRKAADSAVDGIAFVDHHLVIKYINPARAHMHGYEPEELLGKEAGMLYLPNERPAYIVEVVESEGRWEGESTGLRKDGSTFPIWQSISRVDDSEGKTIAHVSITRDISDLKKAQQERDEATALYKNLVENAVVGVFRSTADGRFIYTNKAGLEQFQAENEEQVYGQQVYWFYADPAERENILDLLQKQGSVRGIEIRMRTLKDEIRTMLMSASMADGIISGMLMDITEMKQYEEGLARRSRQLMSLLDASRKINSAVDTESVLRLLVEQAMVLVSASRGTAGLHMDDKIVIREYNERGKLIPMENAFRPGYGVPGWVLENRQPYITNDALNDPHVIPHIQKELGFTKLVDVPIISSDGRLLGCFELHNGPEEKSFTDEDVELLTGLANQAAVALVDAELTEQLRKYADDLKKNEETMRLVIEGSPDFFFYIQDTKGMFIYVSSSVEQLTGYSVSDWQSHYTRFLTDNPINEDVIRNTERTLTTGEFAPAYPVEIVRKDGGRLTLEVYERPIFEDSEIVGIRGVARDVTELRKAQTLEDHIRQQAEQQMRDFYRDAIFSVTDGKLVIIDLEEAERMCQDPLFPPMTIKDAEDIPLARHEIASASVKSGMDESKIDDLLLSAGEALANAYKHAGGGVLSICEGEGSLMVKVSDRGLGMDSLALPKLTLLKGYSGTKSLGMGYATMLALSDRVYLNTGPHGTTVIIEVAKQPKAAQVNLSALPDLW